MPEDLRLAEVMGAMSLAIDVGMGQPMEQGLGVCLLSVRFGEELGLGDDELQRVFDIALLRHIGCTAETVDFAEIMGDELLARASGGPFVDWASPTAALGFLAGHIVRTHPPLTAAYKIARLPAAMPRMRAGAVAVCEVAALLARRFEMDERTAGELVAVYERWDGKGFPGRLARDAIPLTGQVVQVADTAHAFAQAEGPEAAVAVLRRRAGSTFDPALVDRFCRHAQPLLGALDCESLWDAALAAEPRPRPPLEPAAVDAALRAIGEFADLKSPSTVGHSAGVAELAAAAAKRAGLPEGELRRAGWVHDVGRVGVSSAVWEKRGPLNRAEWEQVRLHPYLSERVLARPAPLAALGRVAASHHERLDGSGYHRCVPGGVLGPAERLLAAADAYRAMREPRPHRPALPRDRAAAVLRAEVRAGRLDGDAVEAVLAAAGHRPSRRRDHVAGLTAREVEVLRLVARGLSIREIAAALVIAPKTADAHIQHIYAKLGVSTRGGDDVRHAARARPLKIGRAPDAARAALRQPRPMTASEIVTDMLHSSDAGDFERFRALLDDDCEWVNPVVQATGADAIAENVAAFMAPFPDRRHDISLMVESDGVVAVEGTWVTGTVRAPFAAIIRVRDDRVAAVRLYLDTAALMAQLGAAA